MASDQLWTLLSSRQYTEPSEDFRRLEMSLSGTETFEQAADYRSDEVVGIGRRFNTPSLGTSY